MPELRRIACPSCEAENMPLAVVDGVQEFRCHGCGVVYYGPCGCDSEHRIETPAVEAARSMPEVGWQMSRMQASPACAAGVRKFPGCCS